MNDVSPKFLDRRGFDTGQVILLQGQKGSSAYVLGPGAVEIVRMQGEEH